ncbi:hypothetical protein EVAR_44163_1, partial [Eumeta japonica]
MQHQSEGNTRLTNNFRQIRSRKGTNDKLEGILCRTGERDYMREDLSGDMEIGEEKRR